MATLSIIIPTYNRFTLVKATLDSIKAQSYSIFECLIVDDNSSDGTWELLTDFCKSDHRFKALRKPSHLPKGPS
ncbi:MAG TPA: glycosyltransferase family 2 protein, partial [Cellvibrionaceae bacterium]|nr:glycosyltransferase family 2 protein [Cellvibrionaceae bacterium]